MPLNLLGKLGAVGAGVSEALPNIIERQDKRLNAEFVSELHRFTQLGDDDGMQQLLQDPKFQQVSPEVRQKAMQVANQAQATMATIAQRKATRDAQERSFELRRTGEVADDRRAFRKLGAEGFEFDAGEPDPFGRPTATNIRRGPELERQFQAEVTLSGKKQTLKEKLEAYDNRKSRLQRAIFAAAKDPSLIKGLNDDIQEDVLLTLSEQGISTTGPKRMPLAFMLRMSELRSALDELHDLQERITAGRSGQGPLAGFMASVPGTESQVLRAHIDRVKQRIGKALEGGVLRKEDEEKYKKILPTIFDTQNVSDGKYEGLVSALSRDMETLQRTFDEFGGRIDPDDVEAAQGLMEKLFREQGLSFGTVRGQSFVDQFQIPPR